MATWKLITLVVRWAQFDQVLFGAYVSPFCFCSPLDGKDIIFSLTLPQVRLLSHYCRIRLSGKDYEKIDQKEQQIWIMNNIGCILTKALIKVYNRKTKTIYKPVLHKNYCRLYINKKIKNRQYFNWHEKRLKMAR